MEQPSPVELTELKHQGDAPEVIYVVDDETPVAEILGITLEHFGYQPEVFTKPEEALIAFQKASPKPRLLITDYMMPGIDGLELIKRFRDIDPKIKTISASGTLHVEDLKNAPAVPDRRIAKPFFPSQLITIVEELLDAS